MARSFVACLAILSLATSCSSGDAGDPPEPGGTPTGFGTSDWVATAADGTDHRFCAWHAGTDSLRGRGLMGVTSLGDCPAMAFVYDQPVQQAFYMFQTVLPLSIAWFAPGGAFVSSADMPPCPTGVPAAECPRYSSAGPFTVAVEVERGHLADLGLTPGARLTRAT